MHTGGIQVYENGKELHRGELDAKQNTQERLFLKASMFMIYCDRIYDLLSNKQNKKVKMEHYIDKNSQQVVAKFVNMSERILLNSE